MNLWMLATSAALLFQGALITADEFLFHRKRWLPKWEMVGHPIDTFCFLLFFLSLSFLSSESGAARVITALLAAFSCLIITKDEWVHKLHAEATENWLHSMLFVVHPIVAGLFWFGWFSQAESFQLLLMIAETGITLFLIYQMAEGVRRWNPT